MRILRNILVWEPDIYRLMDFQEALYYDPATGKLSIHRPNDNLHLASAKERLRKSRSEIADGSYFDPTTGKLHCTAHPSQLILQTYTSILQQENCTAHPSQLITYTLILQQENCRPLGQKTTFALILQWEGSPRIQRNDCYVLGTIHSPLNSTLM